MTENEGKEKPVDRVEMYRKYVENAAEIGMKLLSFECPGCGKEMKTAAAPQGEIWDSLAVCPYCGVMIFKIVYTDSVDATIVGV